MFTFCSVNVRYLRHKADTQMQIDSGLHRDQKRLAMAKLAMLVVEHPLREKYEEWIRDLDERIRAADRSMDNMSSAEARSAKTASLRAVGDASQAATDIDLGTNESWEAARPVAQQERVRSRTPGTNLDKDTSDLTGHPVQCFPSIQT
jgi:conjugal transfer/entry exclusion protein